MIMTLQEIIEEMEQEIEHCQKLLNEHNFKGALMAKWHSKRLTISKYLALIKKLNEEAVSKERNCFYDHDALVRYNGYNYCPYCSEEIG